MGCGASARISHVSFFIKHPTFKHYTNTLTLKAVCCFYLSEHNLYLLIINPIIIKQIIAFLEMIGYIARHEPLKSINYDSKNASHRSH